MVHASFKFSLQKRGTDDGVSVTLSLILFDGEEAFTSFRHGDTVCAVTGRMSNPNWLVPLMSTQALDRELRRR